MSPEAGNFMAGHMIQYPSARLALEVSITELLSMVLPHHMNEPQVLRERF